MDLLVTRSSLKSKFSGLLLPLFLAFSVWSSLGCPDVPVSQDLEFFVWTDKRVYALDEAVTVNFLAVNHLETKAAISAGRGISLFTGKPHLRRVQFTDVADSTRAFFWDDFLFEENTPLVVEPGDLIVFSTTRTLRNTPGRAGTITPGEYIVFPYRVRFNRTGSLDVDSPGKGQDLTLGDVPTWTVKIIP